MKDHHVDADQVCKHIKYTEHWLEKANRDFEEKNFANGGIVLNIARAELTAAWEEAMQLKAQVFTALPRKARANWKPLTSVGALASGFLIAFVMMKVMPGTIPGNNTQPAMETTRVVAPAPADLEQARSATIEESAAAVVADQKVEKEVQVKTSETAGETAQPVAPTAVEKAIETAAVAPVVVKQPAPAVRRSDPQPRTAQAPAAKKHIAAFAAPTQQTEHAETETQAKQQAVSVMPVVKRAPLPYSPIAGQSTAFRTHNQTAEKKENKELGQAEVIDLYRTAAQALEM